MFRYENNEYSVTIDYAFAETVETSFAKYLEENNAKEKLNNISIIREAYHSLSIFHGQTKAIFTGSNIADDANSYIDYINKNNLGPAVCSTPLFYKLFPEKAEKDAADRALIAQVTHGLNK